MSSTDHPQRKYVKSGLIYTSLFVTRTDIKGHKQRGKQTDKQTDRHTDRQTDIQTDRETNRRTD